MNRRSSVLLKSRYLLVVHYSGDIAERHSTGNLYSLASDTISDDGPDVYAAGAVLIRAPRDARHTIPRDDGL